MINLIKFNIFQPKSSRVCFIFIRNEYHDLFITHLIDLITKFDYNMK